MDTNPGVPDAPIAPYAPYASFWVRFVAALIDGLILSAAQFALGGSARDNGAGFVIGFLYNWLMLGLNDGRTLGKMVMGIRIARPDGKKIDLGTAAVRSAMALVSGAVLLLGYLWAAWDRENRTWHDMVANTRAFRISR